MSVAGTLRWLRGHRTRSTAAVALLLGLAGLSLPLGEPRYSLRLTATVSAGEYLELRFNQYAKPPLRAPLVPGLSDVYELGPWHGPITRVRIDPSNVAGAQIELERLDILRDDRTVLTLDADDLASWPCRNLERLSGDGGPPRLVASNSDPVCHSGKNDLAGLAAGEAPGVFDRLRPAAIRRLLHALTAVAAGLLLLHLALWLSASESAPESGGEPRTGGGALGRLRRHAPLMLFYVALALILTLRSGQDMNWDLRNYHLYGPYYWLEDRFDLDVQAAGVQTHVNPILHVPFYLAARVWQIDPLIVNLTFGGLHGLALWAVHRLVTLVLAGTRRRLAEVLGGMAALTGAFGAGFRGELGTSMHDNTLSVLVLTALLALLASVGRSGRRAALLVGVAGLLAGLAAGAKLSMAIYAIGLGAATLVAGPTMRRRLSGLLGFAAGGAVGLLLTGGPWMWEMVKHFGSPLFPFYNAILRSPYARTDVNFTVAQYGPPEELTKILFYPFFFLQKQHLVGVPFRDARLAAAYLAVVVLVLVWALRRRRTRNAGDDPRAARAGVLLVSVVVAYVLWQQLFSQYRFAIPIELLSPVLVLVALAALFRRQAALLAAALPICLALVVTTIPTDWGRVPWSSSFFGVEQGDLSDYAGANLLIWDFPNAYLAPYFPQSTAILRPQSQWNYHGTKMWERLEAAVAQDRDAYLLETDLDAEPHRDGVLALLGFARTTDCRYLRSAIDVARICALDRMEPATGPR